MSLWMTVRHALGVRSDQGENCGPCAHFCQDPAKFEAALPGLTALSSGTASVRARDGLCLRHDRIINGRKRCAAFSSARADEVP
ncbi:hypothetical protein [Luteimonas sp. 100069]|uniref:hypothetical protein n=1 Tax=Luteimonas sp. 100069 TaxID=2006109 RepID=UPI000F4E544F|nr:hypothetical protein [Luteimonas sp. 100069]RPD88555.1 hypothetical protein EGK76_05295 [Luteimonas sp. 100069]